MLMMKILDDASIDLIQMQRYRLYESASAHVVNLLLLFITAFHSSRRHYTRKDVDVFNTNHTRRHRLKSLVTATQRINP
jgi:hypothetical protein